MAPLIIDTYICGEKLGLRSGSVLRDSFIAILPNFLIELQTRKRSELIEIVHFNNLALRVFSTLEEWEAAVEFESRLGRVGSNSFPGIFLGERVQVVLCHNLF